jgi:hypothetical protein
MRQVIVVILAGLSFCSARANAQSNPSPGGKKPTKSSSSSTAVNAKLTEMQQAIEAQQQQIQRLVQQLESRDTQLQQWQQQMNQVQSAASQAQQRADSANSAATQQQKDVAAVKNDVADLKTNATNTALSLEETQKNINSAIESPLAIHFKGVTLTPGGFFAAETVWRNRALGADINTPFNSVPLPGSSQTKLSEFYGSGRQSRIAMLAESKLKSAKLSGYVEADFLSAAVTSNNNQSNSYSLRQRQAWGQAAFDNGWSFTGGQMWSLVTETKKGVDNRTEALPMTIDAQYTAGFSWARQYGVRVSRNFNNKFWVAAAMENSQTTFAAHNNVNNALFGSLGNSGGLYNAFNGTYSFNPSPDIVAKVVVEPGFGHYEIFGVLSEFRDRIFPCAEIASAGTCPIDSTITTPSAAHAHNVSQWGGGLGANARWSLLSKHLDIGGHVLGGSGVGRYGSAGLPDVTIRSGGAPSPLKNYQGLATVEWHGPKLDIYLNAGGEYASRSWDIDPISGKAVGYGSPLSTNTACFAEPLPGTATNGFTPGSLGSLCTGDTRALIEGTVGFWFRLYNGPKGRVQWGPQYSYVTRNTWSGVGNPAQGIPAEPHGVDNLFLTSFRYYLP